MNRVNKLFLYSVLSFIFVSESIASVDLGIDALYSANYLDTTNKFEGTETKIDELSQNYKFSAFAAVNSRRHKSSFVANLEFVDYDEETIEDRSLSSFIGSSEINITQRSISWVFVNALGYYDSNPDLQINKKDQKRVNHFVTGPKFRFKTGPKNDVGANFFYTNHERTASDLDYEIIDATLFWDYSFSLREKITLSLDHSELLYNKKIDNLDHTIVQLTAAYLKKTRANEYQFKIGASLLDGVEVEDESDQLTANVVLDWRHLFNSALGMEFTVSGVLNDDNIFTESSISSSGVIDNNTGSGLYYDKTIKALLFYSSRIGAFDVGISSQSFSYIDLPNDLVSLQNDHTVTTLSSHFATQLTRSIPAGIGLSIQDKDYKNSAFKESLATLELGMGYLMTRNINLDLGVSMSRGEGNIPRTLGNQGAREFDEYLVSFGVHWDPYKEQRARSNISTNYDLSLIE